MNPPNKPGQLTDTAADGDAKLPHDRDETAAPAPGDAQRRKNRAPIEQARRDVESGMVDTERIGTPNDVPTRRTGNDRRS